MKGGTLRQIKEGDILQHMQDIFSRSLTVIGQSGTSIIFRGDVSDMFEPGFIVMKIQYLGPAYAPHKDGALFPITGEKWKQEIETQINADKGVIEKYGKSFIPSIVFSIVGALDLFPSVASYFKDVREPFGFTFMETFPNAKSFIDITKVLGDIHHTQHESLTHLIPLAIKEENMLMSVGYKQTDSSFGNFLDVDGRVIMIDFGRVVKCDPGPEVEHPEEVFLIRGGNKKTRKKRRTRINKHTYYRHDKGIIFRRQFYPKKNKSSSRCI